MSGVGTVLVLAADPEEWAEVCAHLNDQGYRLFHLTDPGQVVDLVEHVQVDLVLCEEVCDVDHGVLRKLRVAHPYVLRVLVREGAGTPVRDAGSVYQLVRKPLDAVEVGMLVKRALETRELARRHRLLSREFKFKEDSPLLHHASPPSEPVPAPFGSFEKLVFASEAMAELCAMARRAAGTNLPILIQGETGTGKELLARAVHFHSARRQSPLMVQNSGGMTDELLHSELFGHRRGSFTGAVSDRLGLFRAADGGTVFLDEISEVSPAFQVSLLRFLQEGEVKPIGSDQTAVVDVRILVASNRPLASLVSSGSFRQDLYFRLKGVELTIPPLRDRPADIPVLAEFFARKHAAAFNRRVLGVASDVMERLAAYSFPGNVRELENEMRRMVALASDGSYLTAGMLSPQIAAVRRTGGDAARWMRADGRSLKHRVEAMEKDLVHDSLARNRWNKTAAARDLGVSRVGLDNKIRRYGIEP